MKTTTHNILSTTKKVINNAIVIIEHIETTIRVTATPFVKDYYTLSINGEFYGSHEISKPALDWHLANQPILNKN